MEDGNQEAGVVAGGGQQARRGVRRLFPIGGLDGLRLVHAGGAGEAILPDIAAVAHAERCENLATGELGERRAGELLDRLLEIDEPLARVAPALPRREADLELLATPVGQAGGVGEDHARGDAPVAVVMDEALVGEIGGERRVEGEDAAVRELQHEVGEDRLAERRRLKEGVRPYRLARGPVGDAEGAAPVELAIADHRDRQAGHVAGAEQLGDPALELHPRVGRGGGGEGHRDGGGEGEQDGREGEARHGSPFRKRGCRREYAMKASGFLLTGRSRGQQLLDLPAAQSRLAEHRARVLAERGRREGRLRPRAVEEERRRQGREVAVGPRRQGDELAARSPGTAAHAPTLGGCAPAGQVAIRSACLQET